PARRPAEPASRLHGPAVPPPASVPSVKVALSASDGETQAQGVEAMDDAVGVGAEEAGDGAQVVAADGEHPAVEVLALHLDHLEVALQHVGLGLGEPLEGREVDGDLVRAFAPYRPPPVVG